MMAILAGKLAARREDCAPVAGKSTLNRLELSKLAPTRYHKISHNPVAIKNLLVDLFVEAHERAPRQIVLDLDATDDPLHGEQEGRFFHGYYVSAPPPRRGEFFASKCKQTVVHLRPGPSGVALRRRKGAAGRVGQGRRVERLDRGG